MRVKMADEQAETPNLPMEIIREILAWLPVKSLRRFRCVSKAWNSLICECEFVRMHFNKAIEHGDFLCQRRRVVIKDDEYFGTLFSIDLDKIFNHIDVNNAGNDDGDGVLVEIKLDYLQNCVGLVLHCNGLLFLRTFDGLKLFNPATMETKIVAKPPKLDKTSYVLYGFGFDLCTLDYKVVSVGFNEDELRFGVYSLKSDTWRACQRGYPYKYLLPMVGRVVNGGIHWLVSRVDERSSMALISFILVEEEVQELPLPPGFTITGDEDEEYYYLSIYMECLCMGKEHDLEFWVMKEYGVAESWTKISILIPFSEGLHSGFMKMSHHLLLSYEEGRLVMYNFDEGRFQTLSICGVPNIYFAGIYLESLVSPNNYSILD